MCSVPVGLHVFTVHTIGRIGCFVKYLYYLIYYWYETKNIFSVERRLFEHLPLTGSPGAVAQIVEWAGFLTMYEHPVVFLCLTLKLDYIWPGSILVLSSRYLERNIKKRGWDVHGCKQVKCKLTPNAAIDASYLVNRDSGTAGKGR